MNLKEYRNSISQIQVSHERKKELWTELTSREPKKRKKSFFVKVSFRIALTVGTLVCIFLIMNQSVALAENSPGGIIQQVQEFFLGILKTEDNNIINQSDYNMTDIVEQNIYCDENEHIRMEILEQLADGMTVLLTVRYTGLDAEGIQWLSTNTENGFLEENFRIMPLFPDNNLEMYGVNYMSEINFLHEMNTDKEYFFTVELYASSREYMSDKIVFRYRMPEEGDDFLIPSVKEAELDASIGALDFVVYEIVDKGEHPACELRCLYVSGLSYAVCGKVKEDYEMAEEDDIWSLADFGLLCKEGEDEELLMITNTFSASLIPREENQYSDIIIQGGVFYESEEFTAIKAFDPNAVSKLVFYDENGEHTCDLIKLEEE